MTQLFPNHKVDSLVLHLKRNEVVTISRIADPYIVGYGIRTIVLNVISISVLSDIYM